MPGITGQGTTFNMPNFVGELFAVTREDTPILSAIGGLTGGEAVTATTFQWQTYDLRPAAINVKVEGADAPEATARVRGNITNVVEIHQEAVDVTYTKQAATGQYSGANIAGVNPIQDELAFQVQQQLKQVARDVEYSFINGIFNSPNDNTAPRSTRGLLNAIVTNAVDAAGAELTEDMLSDLMQSVWDNGGISETETRTLVCNSWQKRMLSKIFVKQFGVGFVEQSRNVGGVNVQTIETDFGKLNIMLNGLCPSDTIMVLSLERLKPVFLEIPGKGHFFLEPLAKVGASDKAQLYGEIGLMYGNEEAHGKITGLATAPVAP